MDNLQAQRQFYILVVQYIRFYNNEVFVMEDIYIIYLLCKIYKVIDNMDSWRAFIYTYFFFTVYYSFYIGITGISICTRYILTQKLVTFSLIHKKKIIYKGHNSQQRILMRFEDSNNTWKRMKV